MALVILTSRAFIVCVTFWGVIYGNNREEALDALAWEDYQQMIGMKLDILDTTENRYIRSDDTSLATLVQQQSDMLQQQAATNAQQAAAIHALQTRMTNDEHTIHQLQNQVNTLQAKLSE